MNLNGLINSNENFEFLELRLQPCYLAANASHCIDGDSYKKTFELHTIYSKYLVGQVFVLDTAFNPQSKDPLVKYIETKFALRFSE